MGSAVTALLLTRPPSWQSGHSSHSDLSHHLPS